MKASVFRQESETMYVEKQMTLAEITKAIPVSNSTLRDWKKQYGWAAKRKKFRLSVEALHTKLFKLAQTLTARVEADLAAGEKVSAQTINAIAKLLSMLPNTEAYESAEQARKKDKPEGKKTQAEKMAIINNAIFGGEEK